MNKIGIVCAGDKELKPFLVHITDAKVTEKAMLKFYEGMIGNTPVVALYSGVCKVNAAIATQILIDIYHVNIIINAGTAGGMDEKIKLFDTIIAEQTAYHDVADNILTEFHPWLEDVYFPSDKILISIAKEYSKSSKYPIYFGKMVTGEAFIEDSGRAEINAKHAPLSVDMETASIAHVCYANNIPFIAIRSITDTATHSGAGMFEQNVVKASEIACNITIAFIDKISSEIIC